MNPETVVILSFQVCLAAYLVGAFFSIVFMRLQKTANFVGFTCAVIGGLAGCMASIGGLGREAFPSLIVWPLRMPLFTFTVHLDPLACFFILVISLLAIAISIYSQGYVPHYYGKKNVGALVAFYNLLLLSNTLVFCADNAVLICAKHSLTLAPPALTPPDTILTKP